jgi:hypothetical protein
MIFTRHVYILHVLLLALHADHANLLVDLLNRIQGNTAGQVGIGILCRVTMNPVAVRAECRAPTVDLDRSSVDQGNTADLK